MGAQHKSEHPKHGRLDWFGKARSRAFVKQGPDLQRAPKLALLVGTWFYTGLSPVASGTVGSAAAALIYYGVPALHSNVALLLASAVVLLVGTWSGEILERALETPDPGIVVIDEVLGQWLALLTFSYAGDVRFLILAFLFFRAFDILKPAPARYFERRPGGLGIMLDDAVAGLYAAIAANLVMYVLTR